MKVVMLIPDWIFKRKKLFLINGLKFSKNNQNTA